MSLPCRSWRDFYRGVMKPGRRKFRAACVGSFHVKRRDTASEASVSRETRGRFTPRTAMFHVKRPSARLNEVILLPYTKFPEDDIEHILDIHAPQQAPQRMGGGPKFLGGQFLALPDHVHASPQRRSGLLQQFALTRPADQAAFAGAEVILCESDQGCDQLGNAVAAAGRDSVLGL